MSLSLSFFSGILAAFTPCIVVLFPILLYRFSIEDKNHKLNLLIFVLSFIFSYLIFGFLISSLFNSFVENGLKFGLGLLFIILGILGIFNKLNPLNYPLIKNPLLLGILFSLIVTTNPCTLPYLSLIIASSNKISIFSNLVFFALGIIIPPIIFAIFGKNIINIANKTKKIGYRVNKIMHYILIISGVYLIFTIKRIEIYDIYIISIFLFFIFFILLKSFFILNEKKDLFKLKNILIILALFLILFGVFTNCKSYIDKTNEINSIFNFNNNYNNEKVNYNNEFSCSNNINECEVCKRCIYNFSIATFIGFLGIILFRKGKK